MAQKKLVSVRLDEEDLAQIDNWASRQPYHKRSDAIDAAVRFTAWLIRQGYMHKIIRFWPMYDTVDNFDFNYHREP